MDRIIFLDRDGTLNEEVDYLFRPEDMKLLPGVAAALSALKTAGFKLVVVTNQAGVARGYYSEEDVNNLHRHMNEELKKYGASVDYFFYCPHHPVYGIGEYKKKCNCRKPETGLLKMAEQYYKVDKEHSYMIGDNRGDMGAGRNYGIPTILVSTGYGGEIYQESKSGGEGRNYDFYAQDLTDAAEWIMERERSRENEQCQDR